jgi:hypothetical protein
MTDIHSCSYHCDKPECIKAQRDELRERLAQPEQEPVLETVYETIIQWDESGGKRSRRELARRIVALYNATQPERHELQAKGEHPAPCARYCEATAFQIVIRNLKAQLAQPEQEQEPVAWLYESGNDRMLHWYKPPFCGTPLYTAPPQRLPLTDGELADLWYKQSLDWLEFGRAIEAAHGIKGEA